MIRWLGTHAFLFAIMISLVALFEPGPLVPSAPNGSDKIVHAALFASLAITGRSAGVGVRLLAVGLVCYGAISEVLQAVLPIRRDGDVHDFLADVVGITIGLLVVAGVRRWAGRAGPRA